MHIIRLTEQEKFSISGAAECLEWKIRFKVALGVAEGLQYLHCECHRRIIHRDITASNILLTEDNEPQVITFPFFSVSNSQEFGFLMLTLLC